MLPVFFGVPASVPVLVNLANFSPIAAGETSPNDANAGMRVNGGDLEQTTALGGATWSTIQTWLLGGAVADYDFKYTETDNEGTAGLTTGLQTAQGANGSPEWHCIETGTGTVTSIFTLEIFRAGDTDRLARLTLRKLEAVVNL